jgi:putative endonuclease
MTLTDCVSESSVDCRPCSWWLYLIECQNGGIYTGISPDVEARYAVHLAGKGARYTKINRPLRLIGKIPFLDRRRAAQAEVAFKRLTKYEKQDRIPAFQCTYEKPFTDHRRLISGDEDLPQLYYK